MTFEEHTIGKNPEKYGVQEVKIENHYYVVSVIWKDGIESVMYFPKKGFDVVNPKTKKNKYISAENAVSILKEHSLKYNRNDFSWLLFADE